MSADAKAWLDDAGWHAIHDGECKREEGHHETAYDLVRVLQDVEACMRKEHMRWETFVYTNGELGLKGWTW